MYTLQAKSFEIRLKNYSSLMYMDIFMNYLGKVFINVFETQYNNNKIYTVCLDNRVQIKNKKKAKERCQYIRFFHKKIHACFLMTAPTNRGILSTSLSKVSCSKDVHASFSFSHRSPAQVGQIVLIFAIQIFPQEFDRVEVTHKLPKRA